MYRSAPSRLVYRSTMHGVDAVDPQSGQTAWSWATALGPQALEPPFRVDVRDGQVFFLGLLQQGQAAYRGLVCLDAGTGALRWVFNLEPLYPASSNQILLAFTGEVVILTSLGTHANTAAISRHDGRCLWARQEAYPKVPALSVEGETSYYDRTGFER